MNSYKILNAWDRFCSKNPRLVKPMHHAILLHAITVCNRLHWPEEFQFPTDAACQFIGIVDRETFTKNLKGLIEFGAIREVQAASGLHVARFVSFIGASLYLPIKSEGIPAGASNSSSIKPVKQPSPPQEVPALPLPFTGDAFTNQWKRWNQYRKERGFPAYKETGLKAALAKLEKLSEGNESKAIRIIEESMANNWRGLFELKEKNSNQASAPKPAHPNFIVETR